MAAEAMTLDAEAAARREAIGLLARAPQALLAAEVGLLGELTVTLLRQPEVGLAMVRGMTGGGGRPFNLGEATVVRCTVRLSDGTVGVSAILGRDKARARLAAVFDALWQRAETRDAVTARILEPTRRAIAEADAVTRAETAATRVDFFTMVRGED